MIFKGAIFGLLWSCVYLDIVSSANILAIYPYHLYSHFKAFEPLIEELIRRGHSLTLFSSIPLSDEFRKNYSHINIEKYNDPSITGLNVNSLSQMNQFEELVFLTQLHIDVSENIIKCPEVQRIIRSKNHYDLIIGELFFSTDTFFAFGRKFNAPVITTTTTSLLSYHSWILGNPDPHYFPNFMLKLTGKMSFASRAINMGFNILSILLYEFYRLPQYQILIEKYFDFDKENLPNIKDIMKNISVSLVNSHQSLAYIKPDLPNIVNVAGIHFTSPKPLPQHVQKFMDEAEHGVIYVSLGSLLQTDPLLELGITLIGILNTLPQRIVMKWDQKLLPYASNNILMGEWFPQSDILNHPDCRLFITHGGYHSLLESLNASIPVVGIPFYGDQHYNLAMVEYFELGMKVELENIHSELPGKINEVLENPKYQNNMHERSLLFRNRLASPLDTAMYWVDHVLKHKDTSHLKPASVRLTWYEFYSLDVLGVLLALAVAFFYTLKYIILRITSLILVMYVKIRIKLRKKGRKNL